MNTPHSNSCRPALTALSAAMLLTLASAAQAEGFQVGGRLGYRQFSNVLNAQDDKKSDGMLSATLFGNLEESIGRQRLYANASASSNRYRKSDEYNHLGYSAGVGLDWSTVERISGNLNANMTQSLEDFGLDLGKDESTAKNLFRTQSFGATARVGVVTKLTAEASYSLRKVSYSLASYDDRETTQNTWGASLRYRPSPPLSLGVGLRHTSGKMPSLNESFTRDDFDLLSSYSVAGVHNFNGRLSWSKTDYDSFSGRNIDGVTAALSWNWIFTPKTSLTTSYMRDTGADSAFFLFGEQQVPLQFDNSQVANVLQTRLNYQATAKINAYLDARFSRRKTVSRQLGVDSFGHDNQRNFAFGIGWAPVRSTSVGCDIGTLSRSADLTTPGTPPVVSNRNVSATHFGCSVQVVLQ